MGTDAYWHRGHTLAAGQVAEFKVWGELIRQSLGGLHVFLPLRDLGIDAVVHRLSDGAYVAVQVKARTELTPAGQVHITVTASSLVDDAALVIGVLVDGDRLGPMLLVVDEATFRRLAVHDVVEGREYLTAAFEMHSGGTSRWLPFLVPREQLAERFGGAAGPGIAEDEDLAAAQVDRGREGFLGEMEITRRLAEAESLNLFRPFPDVETVELLVRHAANRKFLGLQVKTSGFDRKRLENRVHLRRSSFRPAPTTFVCVLSWDRDERRFQDDCLLFPSTEIEQFTRVEGAWFVLELQPGSHHHRRLDAYRTPLDSLARTVESMFFRDPS
ncbi:MAG TPA: hypothetical protein VGU71_15040 [Candidatus Dormibacteraeota bacterium]|nr:hypothetical protein [Candidatus Dormibacteraeota bacterium]